jgi:hypothetical protein
VNTILSIYILRNTRQELGQIHVPPPPPPPHPPRLGQDTCPPVHTNMVRILVLLFILKQTLPQVKCGRMWPLVNTILSICILRDTRRQEELVPIHVLPPPPPHPPRRGFGEHDFVNLHFEKHEEARAGANSHPSSSSSASVSTWFW